MVCEQREEKKSRMRRKEDIRKESSCNSHTRRVITLKLLSEIIHRGRIAFEEGRICSLLGRNEMKRQEKHRCKIAKG